MTDTYDDCVLCHTPLSTYLFYHSHNHILLLSQWSGLQLKKKLIEHPEIVRLRIRAVVAMGGKRVAGCTTVASPEYTAWQRRFTRVANPPWPPLSSPLSRFLLEATAQTSSRPFLEFPSGGSGIILEFIRHSIELRVPTVLVGHLGRSTQRSPCPSSSPPRNHDLRRLAHVGSSRDPPF
jgi:hypothetical protein